MFCMKAKLSTKSAKGDIVLAIDASVMPDKKEAYILDASGNSIIIKGNSPAGVFNGIQTLRQIIKNNGGVKSVEKGTITDYPAFSWRAFMLDEGRHFKGEKVVLQLLDEMAALKLNTFHWHLTEDQGWRIEIKKYPKLTEIGAYRDSTEIGHFGNNKFDGKRHAENNKKYAYDKVIMLAGGVGFANKRDALKGEPEAGEKVVVIGGDNYRIGMGGGAVSSVNTGQYKSGIELNAVQRANPEMQKRAANVIRAVAEADENPVISIHDHDASS